MFAAKSPPRPSRHLRGLTAAAVIYATGLAVTARAQPPEIAAAAVRSFVDVVLARLRDPGDQRFVGVLPAEGG